MSSRTSRDVFRLLVVEDDRGYAGLVRTMLEDSSSVRFDTDYRESLHDAIQRLAAAQYDAVLLDLGLPDAQQLEGLERIVSLAPDLPIVILSGAEDEWLAVGAVKGGAQDYLIKGNADSDGLTRAIRYAIERKRAELEIKRLACRDALTDLPNRILFKEHLDAAIKRARRGAHVAGLLFVDLDEFKQINDTLGHDAGDEVLRSVAVRLRQSLRDNDTLARLGGDEFVAIVEVKRRAELGVVAENLLRRFERPIEMAGHEVFLTASIGVSAYPDDGADVTALLRNADRAMYRAKMEGRDTHRFYSADADHSQSPLAVNAGLRRAIERNELVLHFQPLVDLATYQIAAIEALVRWRQPGVGLVLPSEFIPVAEQTGLILAIERWVIESAINDALRFHGSTVKLAVNLAARHFEHPDVLSEVQAVTDRLGFDPGRLELELTERGLMHSQTRALHHLAAFRQLGIAVAIDDFGTGYSCLGLMKQLPLNALKIDRSFIRHCATDPVDQALVAAMIRMGRALGLAVTAEGVETAAQLKFVADQGVDRAQGWLFSRPLGRRQLGRLLADTPVMVPDIEAVS